MVRKIKKIDKEKKEKIFYYKNIGSFLADVLSNPKNKNNQAIFSKKKSRQNATIKATRLKYAPQKELIEGMDLIYNHPITKSYFGVPFPSSFEEIKEEFFIRYSGDLEKEILWTSIYLKKFNTQIDDFIILKKKYETAFLLGDYETALEYLNLIEKKLGLSTWFIENKIILLNLKDGIKAQKDYYKNINENEKLHFNIKILTEYYSIKAEPNFSIREYREKLFDFLNQRGELEKEYYLFKLDYFELDSIEHIGLTLCEDLLISVVDGYETLIKILQRLCEKDIEKYRKILIESLNFLKDIKDNRLEKLLNFLDTSSIEKNIKIVECFDLYEIGDYEKCIGCCEIILQDNILYSELYDIYLNSIIKENREFRFQKTSILYEVFNLFKSLKQVNSPIQTIDLKLNKYISLFSSHSWIYSFNYMILRYYKSSLEAKKEFFLFQLNSIFFDLKDILLLKNLYNLNLFYQTLKILHENSITFDLLEAFNSKSLIEIKKLPIPEERKIRYLCEINYTLQNYNEVIELLENSLKTFDVLSFYTIISCYIKSYLYSKNSDLGFKIIVKNYLDNENSCMMLPLCEAVNLLEKQYDELKKEIYTPIIYHLYDNFINSKLNFRKFQSYEDFLLSNDFEKPSDLIKDLEFEKIPQENLIYFLGKVCNISTMSQSIFFDSSIDLINERIFICEKLLEINKQESEKYIDEIFSLKKEKLIKQGVKGINNSKISLNIEEIKKKIIEEIEPIFFRYKSLENIGTNNFDDFVSISGEEESNLNFGTLNSEDSNLFLSMISKVIDIFTFNEKIGLDTCLSTQIRHGILANTIRKIFENNKIITKRGEKEEYLENDFWLKEYSSLRPEYEKKLSDLLIKGSKEIDDYIYYIKDGLIQIRKKGDHPNGMFDYYIYIDNLERWKKETSKFNHIEVFSEYIINELLAITKKNLSDVRHKFKNEIKEKFNRIHNNLLTGIEEIFPNNNQYFSKLKNKIVSCKIDVQVEVARIADWFELNRGDEVPDYNSDFVKDLVLEAIKKSSSVNINLTSTISKFRLEGWTLKSIFYILYNLFHNITKHSNMENPECDFRFEIIENKIVIFLKNKFTGDYLSIKENTLKTLNGLHNKENSKINHEGGSGFYKIKNILDIELNVKNEIKLDVLEENYFLVTISIGGGVLN